MTTGNPCGVPAGDTRLDHPGATRHIGADEQHRIVAMRLSGMTVSDIARTLNRDRTTISRLCTRLGVKPEDAMLGLRVGRWTVIRKAEPLYARRLPAYLCRCECGTERLIPAQTLRKSESRSCGCLKSELTRDRLFIDLSGQTFARLRVIESMGEGRALRWRCVCTCGNETSVAGSALREGTTRSCGCLFRDVMKERNGAYAKDAPKYGAAHARVREKHGPVTDHTCIDCGATAREWSYNHTDPNELIDDRFGVPYSASPDHYSPRCISCHRKFDRRRSRE